MLILLPASDTKTPVRRGKPLDPAGLSFPPLTPTRAAVLDALIEVSAEPDATDRLGVPAEHERRRSPQRGASRRATAAAETVYSGVLYDALGLADLDPASRRRARAWIVVISALWGARAAGRPHPAVPAGHVWPPARPGAPHRRLAGTARRRAARCGPPGRRGRLPLRRVRHGVAADRGARRADRGHEGGPRPGRRARRRVAQRQAHPGPGRPPDRHRRHRPETAGGSGRGAVGALRGGSASGRTAPAGPGSCTSSNRRPDASMGPRWEVRSHGCRRSGTWRCFGESTSAAATRSRWRTSAGRSRTAATARSARTSSPETCCSSPPPPARRWRPASSACSRPVRDPLVVVVRSHDQLRGVVDRAPDGFGVAPAKYHSDVVFLKAPLTAKQAMRVVPFARESIRPGPVRGWCTSPG